MNNIKWEPANIKPRSIPSKKAYARVSKNSVTFNAIAAKLIEDIDQYLWAKIYVGSINGESTILAFKFLKEEMPDTLPVKKQSKNHKGVTFFSRDLVKNYFNLSGIGILYLQLDVEKLDDDTLGVRLLTEDNLSKELGLDRLEESLEDFENKLKNFDL